MLYFEKQCLTENGNLIIGRYFWNTGESWKENLYTLSKRHCHSQVEAFSGNIKCFNLQFARKFLFTILCLFRSSSASSHLQGAYFSVNCQTRTSCISCSESRPGAEWLARVAATCRGETAVDWAWLPWTHWTGFQLDVGVTHQFSVHLKSHPSRAPNRLRISEFSQNFVSFFILYSRLLADFLSHLGKWVKLIKFEAENDFFFTWKVAKPQSPTSTP